jgi:hypothetical protein
VLLLQILFRLLKSVMAAAIPALKSGIITCKHTYK